MACRLGSEVGFRYRPGSGKIISFVVALFVPANRTSEALAEYVNFHTFATLCAGLALGGMVMFSFVTAPLLFRKLDAEQAAEFMRAAFPIYYGFGGILTAIAGALVWYRLEAIILWFVAAVFGFGYFVVLPIADQLRSARAEGDRGAGRKFAALHGGSVVVNLVQIAALLVAFMRLAA